MLALLLARQGVEVVLLEARHDFDRDFRGDSLMPSTLEIMAQLGLSERLHELPHGEAPQMQLRTRSGSFPLLDFSVLKTAYPYLMQVPQARFLQLITDEAGRYPNFRLIMGAPVRQLIEERGAVRGVRYEIGGGWHEVRATLTIGADGRFSKIRELAGLEFASNDEPIDVLWFRLPRRAEARKGRPGLYNGNGRLVIVLPGEDAWQIGCTLPKGHYKQLRAAGPGSLRASIVELVPWLAEDIRSLQEWNQTSLLSVQSGMVQRWYRDGLLLIGDAAHVMSPVAAVGINCAIQDAVVAANVLGGPLRARRLRMQQLAAVQRKRMRPVRLVQAVQRRIRARLLGEATGAAAKISRLLFTIPWVRRCIVRVVALGLPRVRVETGADHAASGEPAMIRYGASAADSRSS